MNAINAAVLAEQARQTFLWGDNRDHPDGTSVNNKNMADLARELCEQAFAKGAGSWLDILLEEVMEASAEVDEEALITELVQVSAVAQTWAASIRRRQEDRELTEVPE